MHRSRQNKIISRRDGEDADAVAMTTLDGDERSPNGTTNLFDMTMDDDSAATGGGAGASCVRLVHIHKHDDEPMVSAYHGCYSCLLTQYK